MTAPSQIDWFDLAKRRFEYRVLGPLGIVWLLTAVVQVVVNDNWRLGIPLLIASFFAGVIGSSLHRNQQKTYRELAHGPSHDSAILPRELSESDQAYSFARSTMRFATVVAMLIGFMAFDAGHSWLWTIAAAAAAWITAMTFATVVSLAEILVWSWRTRSK